MRGLQRGAASFGSSTASAALELSNRLVQAIQVRAPGSAGQGGPAVASDPVPKAPLTGRSECAERFMRSSHGDQRPGAGRRPTACVPRPLWPPCRRTSVPRALKPTGSLLTAES